LRRGMEGRIGKDVRSGWRGEVGKKGEVDGGEK
jgi:hypothetical protein